MFSLLPLQTKDLLCCGHSSPLIKRPDVLSGYIHIADKIYVSLWRLSYPCCDENVQTSHSLIYAASFRVRTKPFFHVRVTNDTRCYYTCYCLCLKLESTAYVSVPFPWQTLLKILVALKNQFFRTELTLLANFYTSQDTSYRC